MAQERFRDTSRGHVGSPQDATDDFNISQVLKPNKVNDLGQTYL